MPALGGRFREAREARGLTLSEVAEQIRIRSVYLGAIEEENWPAIGAPIYVRGFLRTYARFLALSPEEAVAQFNSETGDREVLEPKPPGAASPDIEIGGSRRRNLAPVLWVAGIVALLLIGYVVYDATSMQNRASSGQGVAIGTSQARSASQAPATVSLGASAASSLSPAPSLSPGASPLAGASPGASPVPTITPGPNTISVLASAPTWLRIAIDGSVQYEGVLKTGSVETFRGKTATVRFGNAGGAQVTIDGKPLGVLGKPGQVLDRTFSL